jgi:hypothetical protein
VRYLDPFDLPDLPILRRRKPGPVPWEALGVDPSDFPLPRPPKPGPPTWEGLLDRQLRVGRMAFLLIQGYSSGRSPKISASRARRWTA